MADFSIYKPQTGELDYVDKYQNFIDAMEGYATEIENAREGESNLLTNLSNNYIGFSLTGNISGASTYKCINMPDATDPQDYATYGQAQGLSGSLPTSITDLDPGTLTSNQIVVIDAAGTGVTGRDSTYTYKNSTFDAEYNKNYNVDVSGGSITVNLPPNATETGNPTAGDTIGFGDLGGNITSSNAIRLDPDATYNKIMSTTYSAGDALAIDTYENCTFKLVYIDSTYGWIITEFQI